MNNYKTTIGLVVLGLAVFVCLDTIYTVDETQQAVVTQFGEPIGRPVTGAGLHFKKPWIQRVHYFDRRILRWDGDAEEITTLDLRHIWVDTTARWRIVDALKFMQSVGSEEAAHARLDDVIDAATRDAISSSALVESVRNSNRLLESLAVAAQSSASAMTYETLERVEVGREHLTTKILESSAVLMPNYGIELVDVIIRRVNYIERVQKKVYERMVSERRRAAAQFRSEGQARKEEIEGQVTKELKQIRSEAYKKAQEIRGQADAKATDIYAEAYNLDPEFYAFTKTLDTYRQAINADTSLILSTDNDFYKYLRAIGTGNAGE